MADRIKLVSTLNYNQNTPTKLPQTKIFNEEKDFLKEVGEAREKMMTCVDQQIDAFVKKSFQNFETTGKLPLIRQDPKGISKIGEGVENFLTGDRILKETQKKAIFAEADPKYYERIDEDFPYRTLSRPQLSPPPKSQARIFQPETPLPLNSPANPLQKAHELEQDKDKDKDLTQHILASERKIRRVPRGKAEALENSFDENCQRKFVGAFLCGTKKFIFVNLMDEQLQFQSLFLDINFKIPFHSKAIVSRAGEYFLCGGIADGIVSGKLYALLFNQRVLNELPAMETPRARHSVLYLQKQNTMLVIGGVSELDTVKPLKSCELYDLTTGKWSSVGKMNFGSIESTLIEREEYVYKIGGKVDEFTSSNYIERYSIKEAIWEIVGYDTIQVDQIFLRLPNRAGGFSSGSSLVLFGGVVHKVRSNSSYKVEISKAKPTLEEWKAVPLAGPIISPVILLQGEAYAIQDIGLALETEAEDLAKKKLVIFSEEQWESVL